MGFDVGQRVTGERRDVSNITGVILAEGGYPGRDGGNKPSNALAMANIWIPAFGENDAALGVRRCRYRTTAFWS
jgi:hypothetical protein